MSQTANSGGERFPAPIYSACVLEHNFADAQRHFLEPLLFIHYAHALMLAEQRIITSEEARRILGALDRLDRARVLAAKYDGSVEDLYFFVERELIASIGEEVAGRLHTARSRNDIDVTLYRMKLREELLEVARELDALRGVLIGLARRHLDTVMPAHTHTQPAQPTTLAHYLSAAIEFLARDVARVCAAFATVNRSPLGACAITTTGFPISRWRTAELLGFEGLAENSYGAVGAVDYLAESMGALSTSMLSLGKFTQDLLVWSMREFDYIRLSDAYVQTSSIMPQKRNPVALEHARVLLSKAFGQSQAVLTSMHNTPFGDIVDVEDDLQPLVFAAFAEAHRALRLLAGALSSVTVDAARLKEKAAGEFLTMTELADTLVREEGLSFKAAHRLVAATIKQLPGPGESPALVVDVLRRVAAEALGRPLGTPREKLEAALDPAHFVAVRRVAGGPAPEVVAQFLDDQERVAEEDRRWLREKTALIEDFPRAIERAKEACLAA
jgi:argininosuccinate lyase